MVLGEVCVDVESRRVHAPHGECTLEPRVFDLLLTLVERAGVTASRDHLIETVWGEVEGSDEALSQAVTKLRRALGDDARAPRFIETVPKLGYRWIFQESPSRPVPTPRRGAVGPVWMMVGAVLAMAVGGAGGVGVYAWAKARQPRGFEIHKAWAERGPDGRCLTRTQVIRGVGHPSEADRAPPPPSAPGCEAQVQPRDFVQR